MSRRAEWPRALLASALVLALGLSGLAAPAQSLSEGLEQAQRHTEQGHPGRAEALLLRLAQAGQVPAMERLALMHWYGPVLFPGGPWKREVAVLWFARAAEHGSELGSHMLAVSHRGLAGPAQAIGR